MIFGFNPLSALACKIYGGVAIAALTFGAVQTVRIEGFLFLDGFKDRIEDLEQDLKDAEKASDGNRQAAERQVQVWEDTSGTVGRKNENEYRENRSVVRNAVRDYANANRVRSEVPICPAAPAAEGTDTAVPVGMPPDTGLVAIGERDLQALADWALVGIQAHNQAVEKIEAGLAEAMPAEPNAPIDLLP